ncbi:MAG: phosphoglycerate dehydrogenase [Anaerolineae bacterium]|nr:phosphoglycerate dehydrogenase [Anaerolineae bacterium]RIK24471.1 MAG: phosphoglycerate dehydrogenase [Anaerolineae bacterium]
MYHILVSDKLGTAALDKLKEYPDVVVDVKTGLSKEQLLEIIPEYDGLIVRSGTQVTADVLAAGKKLRVVGRAGVGVDNIDIKAASMYGIIVMNTPGANSMATAELAVALMLAASRNIPQAHASMSAGEWRRADFVGTQLYRKVLGIIGFGRVGKLVAERAKAFGMEVLAYDPVILEEAARDMGVLLVELDELLAKSDYITLHAALVPATNKLINATTISQMKDGAILINAARGKLIDEQALADALRSGKLAAAAIDVYSSEPPTAENPLISLPNVVHIPHLGASTREAEREVGIQIAAQVVSALRGTDFSYAVNMPFELEGDFASVKPYLDLAETLGRLHAGLADKPIQRLEIEVQGDVVGGLVRAIGAGLLKGVLAADSPVPVNYINAPTLANERGISTTQALGLNNLDYPNLVTCRAIWDGGHRLLAGVLFGGSEPRIVQIDEYRLEARPEGIVLIMQNQDVPGVIGQVGTLLANHSVNIGEWRLGRVHPGGEALSFINLDSEPSEAVLSELAHIKAVTQAKVVIL